MTIKRKDTRSMNGFFMAFLSYDYNDRLLGGGMSKNFYQSYFFRSQSIALVAYDNITVIIITKTLIKM